MLLIFNYINVTIRFNVSAKCIHTPGVYYIIYQEIKTFALKKKLNFRIKDMPLKTHFIQFMNNV